MPKDGCSEAATFGSSEGHLQRLPLIFISMYYVYILWSSISKNFYFGYTENIKSRLQYHNQGLVKSTAPYRPWKLVYYGCFENMKMAKDFERYLKTGSGKAFAYTRLVNAGLLKKDK